MRTVRIVILLMLICGSGYTQGIERKALQKGIQLGIGLPSIPGAKYRSSLSLTGGLFVQYRFLPSWMLGVCGTGLNTFQLGKIHGENASLRFKVADLSLHLYKRYRGFWDNENFLYICGGLGQVYQRVNGIAWDETGRHLGAGLLSQHRGKRYVTQVKMELRAYLLEDSTPYTLLITAGVGL